MINQKNGENVVDKRVLVPFEVSGLLERKCQRENLQGSANKAYNGEVNAVEGSNL